jgi:hypothetical protein
LLQLEQRQSQLIVRVAIRGIDLDGVLILDRGLAILTLIEVALTAFIELLLAHVGIAGASNEYGRDQSDSQNQTKNGRLPHYKSPGTGAVNARLFSQSLLFSVLGYCK